MPFWMKWNSLRIIRMNFRCLSQTRSWFLAFRCFMWCIERRAKGNAALCVFQGRSVQSMQPLLKWQMTRITFSSFRIPIRESNVKNHRSKILFMILFMLRLMRSMLNGLPVFFRKVCGRLRSGIMLHYDGWRSIVAHRRPNSWILEAAMDWVHFLVTSASTEARRASCAEWNSTLSMQWSVNAHMKFIRKVLAGILDTELQWMDPIWRMQELHNFFSEWLLWRLFETWSPEQKKCTSVSVPSAWDEIFPLAKAEYTIL